MPFACFSYPCALTSFIQWPSLHGKQAPMIPLRKLFCNLTFFLNGAWYFEGLWEKNHKLKIANFFLVETQMKLMFHDSFHFLLKKEQFVKRNL